MSAPTPFLSFHSFTDEEVAVDFAEKLKVKEIPFMLEKTAPMLDSVIIGTSSIPAIEIKLRQGDFEKAHTVLEEFYDKQLETIDPGYYLFEFTDTELLEILEKPDTWGYLDQQLAKKILRDKGHDLNRQVLDELKTKRKMELAKPEKAGIWFILIGYFFVLTGILALINIVSLQKIDFSPGGLFISLFMGRHITGDKRTLPDGEIVYAYRKQDRSHGETIAIASVVLLVISIAVFLYITSSG